MEHALKIFALVVWFFMLVFAFDTQSKVQQFIAANPDMVILPPHLELINTGSLSIIGFSLAAVFVVVFVWLIGEMTK